MGASRNEGPSNRRGVHSPLVGNERCAFVVREGGPEVPIAGIAFPFALGEQRVEHGTRFFGEQDIEQLPFRLCGES